MRPYHKVLGKTILLKHLLSQNFLNREGDSRNCGKENLQLLEDPNAMLLSDMTAFMLPDHWSAVQ